MGSGCSRRRLRTRRKNRRVSRNKPKLKPKLTRLTQDSNLVITTIAIFNVTANKGLVEQHHHRRNGVYRLSLPAFIAVGAGKPPPPPPGVVSAAAEERGE
ncbi:hypothetical protein Hanom_Chr08g00718381 [Helianthus anomalus]